MSTLAFCSDVPVTLKATIPLLAPTAGTSSQRFCAASCHVASADGDHVFEVVVAADVAKRRLVIRAASNDAASSRNTRPSLRRSSHQLTSTL